MFDDFGWENLPPLLDGMLLTSGKASRLSVQPVERKHFDAVVKMGSG